jgi:hypothetical protein
MELSEGFDNKTRNLEYAPFVPITLETKHNHAVFLSQSVCLSQIKKVSLHPVLERRPCLFFLDDENTYYTHTRKRLDLYVQVF